MQLGITKEFDGVFKFTNPTKEDFTALWNNKEYTFPAMSCSPLIIPNETLENIQEIRKKFAYKLAVREFYESRFGEYSKLKKMGGGIPPTFDEKILEPMIEKCLLPLPAAKAVVKQGKKLIDENRLRGSKAVSTKDNLNQVFKDDIEETGQVMPDSE